MILKKGNDMIFHDIQVLIEREAFKVPF